MKNTYKFILGILFFVLIISFVNAEQVFKKDSDIDLKVPCFKDGALCNSSTLCNLTTNYPNSWILVNNQQMTNSGSFFNYTIISNQVNQTGDYQNTVYCSDGVDSNYNTFIFTITSTGSKLTDSESTIYIILTIIILLISIFCFYLSVAIPFDNKVINEKGAIIHIRILPKYLKLLIIIITYPLFLWFFNLLVGLSNNFLSLEMYYTIFSVIFNILMAGIIPFEATLFIIFGVNAVKDLNMKKKIKKFGEVFR